MLTLVSPGCSGLARQASAAAAPAGAFVLDVPVTRLVSLTEEIKHTDLPTIAHGE